MEKALKDLNANVTAAAKSRLLQVVTNYEFAAVSWKVPAKAADDDAQDWDCWTTMKDSIATLKPADTGVSCGLGSAGFKANRKYNTKAMSVGFDARQKVDGMDLASAKYEVDPTWTARLFWKKDDAATAWGWSTDVSAGVKFQVKGAATLVASTVAAAAVLALF